MWTLNKKILALAAIAASFVFGFSAWWLGRQTDLSYNNHTPIRLYGQYKKAVVDKGCPVKGKISLKAGVETRIYHLPGDAWYAKLKASDCFKSEAEATAAGFRKAGGR